MRPSFVVLVACLVIACGSRDPDCGTTGLVLVGDRCACPTGTRFICDETSEHCTCEPLVDAGSSSSDGAVSTDGGTTEDCSGEGEMICDRTCVDVRTSVDHCGACDAVCGAPDQCVVGECRDPVEHVSAGATHTCAVHASGRVSCWGRNTDGELGDGTFEQRTTPRWVLDLANAEQIEPSTWIFRAAGSTCARLTSGQVACWGLSALLGTGATASSNTPVVVPDLDRVVDVDVDQTHVCAARSDGRVLCWGSNAYGELGISRSTTDSATPVVVGGAGGIASVTDIASGYSVTCGALRDMTAVCWGSGAGGQLGDGTTPEGRHYPAAVAGLTDVVEIGSGMLHSCARLATGAVACWGSGRSLGIGITNETEVRTTPVLVTGIDDAVDLDVSGTSTCVVHAAGGVSCWGVNPLGDGAYPLPTAIPGTEQAREVTTGGGYVCVVTDERRALCAGWNVAGQLGDGTTVDRTAMVPVRPVE